MATVVTQVEARDKEIMTAVSNVVNQWTRAAVIALYRQIRICDPHLPSMLCDLEAIYRKKLKRESLKLFQE